MVNNEFTPWQSDYNKASATFAIATVLSLYLNNGSHSIMAAVAACTGAYYGCRRLKRGWNRERGKIIEDAAVKSLHQLSASQGNSYEIIADRQVGATNSGENIDCILTPTWSYAKFVVEIKSYSGMTKNYRHQLVKIGHPLWPLKKDIAQVYRQCLALDRNHYHPVLWCPTAKHASYFVHNDILVINGNVDFFDSALRNYEHNTLRQQVEVSFPKDPGKEITGRLKKTGFHYNGILWTGYLTCDEVVNNRPEMEAHGGRITYTASKR